VPYPGRPVLEVLPEFVGTSSTHQTEEQRSRLLAFCAEQYRADRSIHELAELRAGRSPWCVARSTRRAFPVVDVARSQSATGHDQEPPPLVGGRGLCAGPSVAWGAGSAVLRSGRACDATSHGR